MGDLFSVHSFHQPQAGPPPSKREAQRIWSEGERCNLIRFFEGSLLRELDAGGGLREFLINARMRL